MTAPEPREDVAGRPEVLHLPDDEFPPLSTAHGEPQREDVAVAEVLAAHRGDGWTVTTGDGYCMRCSCGDGPHAVRRSDLPHAFANRVAEALAPLIAERVRAAAERAWDEGYRTGVPAVRRDRTNPYRAALQDQP